MYCQDCLSLKEREITYLNIFRKNRHFICNYCLRNYIFIHEVTVVPINNYLMYINTLVMDYKNSNSLMSFLKPYYIFYLKNKLESIILYFDDINDKIYTILNILRLNDIFVIALKNQLKGGINHDY